MRIIKEWLERLLFTFIVILMFIFWILKSFIGGFIMIIGCIFFMVIDLPLMILSLGMYKPKIVELFFGLAENIFEYELGLI